MYQVENIVTKVEIAHHEQFLFLPQSFRKASAAIGSICRTGLVKDVSLLIYAYVQNLNPFLTYRCFLIPLLQTTFENTVTKGEIAQNKQFLH